MSARQLRHSAAASARFRRRLVIDADADDDDVDAFFKDDGVGRAKNKQPVGKIAQFHAEEYCRVTTLHGFAYWVSSPR